MGNQDKYRDRQSDHDEGPGELRTCPPENYAGALMDGDHDEHKDGNSCDLQDPDHPRSMEQFA